MPTGNTITGTTGPDNITVSGNSSGVNGGTVTANDDSVSGLTGNDSIEGGAGNDTLDGGDNDDILAGGAGDDSLVGGNGADTAQYFSATTGIVANLTTNSVSDGQNGTDTLSGIERIWGTQFNDSITGSSTTAGTATIGLWGAGGNDTINGLGFLWNNADHFGTPGDVRINLSTAALTLGGVLVQAGTGTEASGAVNTFIGIVSATGSNTGNDTIQGGSAAEFLAGNGGNDSINGAAGDDVIDGGAGDDTILGGAGSDFIRTGTGSDSVDGGETNARNTISYSLLSSGTISAVFTGAATGAVTKSAGGADSFVNINRIIGTARNDSFDGSAVPTSNVTFAVIFRGSGGNDTITGNGTSRVAADYFDALQAVNVNLGTGVVSQDGFNGQDTLTNVARVTGSNGFNDTLTGGGADETFFVSSAGGNKVINGGGGTDIYRYGVDTAITIDLAAGTAAKAGGGTDSLTAIEGAAGSGGRDSIAGDAQNNTLAGDNGNDTLDGRDGYDTADYTFFSNLNQPGGIVASLTTGTATDSWGSTDTLLNIEQLTGTPFADDLTGKVITDTVAAGGSQSNLRGLAGDDTLRAPGLDTQVDADYRQDPAGVKVNLSSAATVLGGVAVAAGTAKDGFGGTDTLDKIQIVIGSNFDDIVLGGDRADHLYGQAGNDALIGGAGNDTLAGGAGIDSYDGGDGTDVLVFAPRNANEAQPTAGAIASLLTGLIDNDGYGNAESMVGGALNGIEALVGTGFADSLTGGGGDDLLKGGDGGNDSLSGGTGADTLEGGTGDDSLSGGGNVDSLDGGEGNDTLDGGGSADSMAGGAGDDLYLVTDGDIVVEAPGGGTDTVNAKTSWSLGDNVEILVLSGNAVIDGTGNAGDNTITGGSGDNRIAGLEGNDSLSGGAGNDTLDGGIGTDMLAGGTGDDKYVARAGETMLENPGEGTDTVVADLDWTLAANLETLVLTGSADLSGTGNAAANLVTGTGGNNMLQGMAGADTLNGAAGNDVLDGGADVDSLVGGDGDDDYFVTAGDIVVEAPGGGYDQVYAKISWTLASEVEDLLLLGAVALDGTGNGGDNQLFGNSAANLLSGLGGDDLLIGGSGNDTLLGGAGGDTLNAGAGTDVFRWLSPTEGGDLLTGFRRTEDTIEISAAGFGGGLFAGMDVLGSGRFVANKTGLANSGAGTGQFVFDKINRVLLWDADGGGGADAVSIVTFADSNTLTGSEIVII